MAEECIKSPVTSEIIKTNEGNSAGKPRSSKSGRTPHYLKAPGGSCHEQCKHGGTHKFKTKQTNPMHGKTTRKLPNELLLAEDVVVPSLVQKPTTKLEILSNLESQTSDIANVGKQGSAPDNAEFTANGKKKSEVEFKSSRSSKTHSSDQRKIVKPGMASSGTKQVSPEASAMFSLETYSRSMKTKMEPLGAKPMSLPGSTGDSSHRKKNSISSSRDTRTSEVSAKNLSLSSTASNFLEFSSRSPSMRLRKGIAGKFMSPLKNRNKNQNSTKNAEVVQIAKEEAVQEKTLYVINEETEHIPSECTSTSTTCAEDDRNGSSFKMSPDQSLLLPQHLSLPKCPSPKSHEEEFHESSDSADDEGEGCSDSGHGESDSLVRAGTSQRPKQDRTNSTKNETCGAVDLSLRKGEVVVGTQAESSSPRRLKIRQGRAFGDNQNPKADAKRRTFKRREETEGGKNSSTPSSIKVTLKHQDVREKKEGRGLFNNVIEETASKLVKTRKSKVKALVGAFETVISLQETEDLVK